MAVIVRPPCCQRMTLTPWSRSGCQSTVSAASSDSEIFVDCAAVVNAFDAIDDRPALQCHAPDVFVNRRMAKHATHGHIEQQLNRVTSLPSTTNHGKALGHLDGDRLAVDGQCGVCLRCRRHSCRDRRARGDPGSSRGCADAGRSRPVRPASPEAGSFHSMDSRRTGLRSQHEPETVSAAWPAM